LLNSEGKDNNKVTKSAVDVNGDLPDVWGSRSSLSYDGPPRVRAREVEAQGSVGHSCGVAHVYNE